MMFFQALGAGWNLGNSLDAHVEGFTSEEPTDYEKLWLNPLAGRELFEAVAQAGFQTVRIPVTWYPHMGEGHRVDADWMGRVKQVVDDALDAGLTVILNAHHEDWHSLHINNVDYAEERLTALWSQIAKQFAKYDERLLFEGMNEPRLSEEEREWTGNVQAYDCLNRLNQAFVDTIRASGARNAERYLLVPTYAASPLEAACAHFALPKDGRVGVSLHLYQPFPFTHQTGEACDRWDARNPADAQEIEAVFETICRFFTSRQIPVVITEFGAMDKENQPVRLAWTGYVARHAAKEQIPCLWWDNGAGDHDGTLHTFALLDRDKLEWHFPDIVQTITGAR